MVEETEYGFFYLDDNKIEPYEEIIGISDNKYCIGFDFRKIKTYEKVQLFLYSYKLNRVSNVITLTYWIELAIGQIITNGKPKTKVCSKFNMFKTMFSANNIQQTWWEQWTNRRISLHSKSRVLSIVSLVFFQVYKQSLVKPLSILLSTSFLHHQYVTIYRNLQVLNFRMKVDVKSWFLDKQRKFAGSGFHEKYHKLIFSILSDNFFQTNWFRIRLGRKRHNTNKCSSRNRFLYFPWKLTTFR